MQVFAAKILKKNDIPAYFSKKIYFFIIFQLVLTLLCKYAVPNLSYYSFPITLQISQKGTTHLFPFRCTYAHMHAHIRLTKFRRTHSLAIGEHQIKILPARKTTDICHLIHSEVGLLFPSSNSFITTKMVNPIAKRQLIHLIDKLRKGCTIRAY